jgi:hypothetical protein
MPVGRRRRRATVRLAAPEERFAPTVARVVSASQGGASRSATRSPLAWRSSLAFGDMLQLCRDRSATTYHLDATTTQ